MSGKIREKSGFEVNDKWQPWITFVKKNSGGIPIHHKMTMKIGKSFLGEVKSLTLLHLERPKLYRVLAAPSALGFSLHSFLQTSGKLHDNDQNELFILSFS